MSFSKVQFLHIRSTLAAGMHGTSRSFGEEIQMAAFRKKQPFRLLASGGYTAATLRSSNFWIFPVDVLGSS